MRWEERQVGTTRIIRRFLILPRKIGKEYRWLEFVKIKQEYNWSVINIEFMWVDKCFVD